MIYRQPGAARPLPAKHRKTNGRARDTRADPGRHTDERALYTDRAKAARETPSRPPNGIKVKWSVDGMLVSLTTPSSPQYWTNHLSQCDPRPTVTFPAVGYYRHLTGINLYWLVTEAHVREQLAYGSCLKAERTGVEPATFELRVQRHNHYTTRPYFRPNGAIFEPKYGES